MDSLGHYDLVIIGGGIAGLYYCLHAPPAVRVAHRALTKALA
jgi:aspartate oxidase